MLKPTL